MRCPPSAVAMLALLSLGILISPPAMAGPSASWADQPRALVFFSESAPGNAREFLAQLHLAGGHATVIYPGEAAIVYATPAQLSHVSSFVAHRHEDAVDTESIKARGDLAVMVAAVWNEDLRQRAEPVERTAAVHEPHAGAGRLPSGRHVPVDLPHRPLRRDLPDHMPFGAQYYDTSSFLAGTTAVGVWLLESAGSGYDWSVAEETQTLTGVQQSFDNWVGYDTQSAEMTFFLEIRTGAPVSNDPITFVRSWESVWIDEALTAAGWAGANAWEQCFQYNNDLRDTFETNWCYSMFIVDSDPAVNLGRFSGGGYAWAYFGGPWIYMSRYSTWAFNSANYYQAVPGHEMGHIFWATDEYDSGIQQSQGYVNAVDSPNPSVICLMNQNTQTSLCNFTRRQVGWRDLDQNGVMEPLDTPPAAPVDVYSPDPSPLATVTWTGTASVTTLPNLNSNDPYFPPHDITVCTIDAVECRVDGGAWTAATPADGTFDAYVEAYSWTSPILSPGIHTVESRAQSSRGIWTVAFGSDAVDVQAPVDAPLIADVASLRLEPPRPNPARGEALVSYSLPRPTNVTVSIHSVDGARVRTLFHGEDPAGRQSRRWNGRDDGGRMVPAGVYLVRLESPEGRASVKLVWQR